MQNPNEDTEWNDVLRAKGIIPPKEKEITEDEIVDLLEETVAKKTGNVVKNYEDMTLDELDELEDEEEERVLAQYRSQRLAQMKEFQKVAVYGDVKEISAQDYVQEVNQAGEGIWVVLHLYKHGIPLCSLVNQFLLSLAKKFPATKFLKSVSTVCIPNYPDKNLPTIFVYCDGEMKGQFIGPLMFGGMNLKEEELEWMLSTTGAVKTELEEDPRKKNQVKDVMEASLKYIDPDDSDEDD